MYLFISFISAKFLTISLFVGNCCDPSCSSSITGTGSQSPSETPSEDPAVFHPQLHQASPSSPHCSSPAHPIPSSPHTPRCSPAAAIPRRLNYTNTTLYSDWSSSSPVPFTPSSGPSQWSWQSRATPSPSLSYGTGWQTPLRPSPASEMDWRSPLQQFNSGEMDWPSPLPSLPSPQLQFYSEGSPSSVSPTLHRRQQ